MSERTIAPPARVAGTGLAAALGLGVCLALTPAAAQADYSDCGELRVTSNTTKILKAKRMNCHGAKELASDYERKVFFSGGAPPESGDVERIRRFKCRFSQYFEPFELAYKCRHMHQPRKAVKALYPPERKPVRAVTLGRGAKSCGGFRIDGLLTMIRVKISTGAFPCRVARRVMEDLFRGRDTGNWNCIGPQTGYAQCKKRNRGTVMARF